MSHRFATLCRRLAISLVLHATSAPIRGQATEVPPAVTLG